MKIIIDTSLGTDNVTDVLASSENANFPVENLQNDYTTDVFKAENTTVKLTFAVSKGSAIEILNTNATSATVTVGTGGNYVNETGYVCETGYVYQDDGSASSTIYTLPGEAGRLWAEWTEYTDPFLVTVTLVAASNVEAGIARAGYVEEFKDPQYDNGETSDDKSIERELNNGADYFRKRNVIREFDNLVMLETRANAWTFKHDIWDAVGPQPLAVRLVSNSNVTDDEFILFAKRTDVKLRHVSPSHTLIRFGLKETI